MLLGQRPGRRRIMHAVRNDALLPDPAPFRGSGWVGVPPVVVCAEDVCGWLHSVGIPVQWVTFLGTLHWPAAGADLCVGGVSVYRVAHRV